MFYSSAVGSSRHEPHVPSKTQNQEFSFRQFDLSSLM